VAPLFARKWAGLANAHYFGKKKPLHEGGVLLLMRKAYQPPL